MIGATYCSETGGRGSVPSVSDAPLAQRADHQMSVTVKPSGKGSSGSTT